MCLFLNKSDSYGVERHTTVPEWVERTEDGKIVCYKVLRRDDCGGFVSPYQETPYQKGVVVSDRNVATDTRDNPKELSVAEKTYEKVYRGLHVMLTEEQARFVADGRRWGAIFKVYIDPEDVVAVGHFITSEWTTPDEMDSLVCDKFTITLEKEDEVPIDGIACLFHKGHPRFKNLKFTHKGVT